MNNTQISVDDMLQVLNKRIGNDAINIARLEALLITCNNQLNDLHEENIELKKKLEEKEVPEM